MKKTLLFLGFILVIAFVLVARWQNTELPVTIAVDEGYQKYEKGVFVLDVRDQDEWEEGHVPNAVLIPSDELESRLNELPTDEEMIVVCYGGNRSLSATEMLRDHGFDLAQSVSGGISQWIASGYPVTTEE